MRNKLRLAVAIAGFAGVLQAAAIEKAVAEPTGPDTYVITFSAAKTAFPLGVFAIPGPGRSGDAKEWTKAGQPGVEVHLPAGSGQPFFRLQPAEGDSVTVSIRRRSTCAV